MKKSLSFLSLTIVILLLVPAYSVSASTFDISIFQKSWNYIVDFDDMTDAGTIKTKKELISRATLDNDTGYMSHSMDIMLFEGMPPVIRMALVYNSRDWAFVDKVIIKPKDTRYTFTPTGKRDVDGGYISEGLVMVITDQSIGMLKDIVENEVDSVKFRLEGDRKIDGQLYFDIETLSTFYDDYVKSGALEQDYTLINSQFPCDVKDMGSTAD